MGLNRNLKIKLKYFIDKNSPRPGYIWDLKVFYFNFYRCDTSIIYIFRK